MSKKKSISIKTVLRLAAIALALIAGFMVLTPQIYLHLDLGSFGESTDEIKDVLFGNDSAKGAIGAFIGYVLLFLGAIATGVFTFVKVKGSKCITFTAAAVMVIGAVLVLCVVPMYAGANDAKDAIDNLKIGAGPVFAGIFGILGGCGLVASEIVK